MLLALWMGRRGRGWNALTLLWGGVTPTMRPHRQRVLGRVVHVSQMTILCPRSPPRHQRMLIPLSMSGGSKLVLAVPEHFVPAPRCLYQGSTHMTMAPPRRGPDGRAVRSLYY